MSNCLRDLCLYFVVRKDEELVRISFQRWIQFCRGPRLWDDAISGSHNGSGSQATCNVVIALSTRSIQDHCVISNLNMID